MTAELGIDCSQRGGCPEPQRGGGASGIRPWSTPILHRLSGGEAAMPPKLTDHLEQTPIYSFGSIQGPS